MSTSFNRNRVQLLFESFLGITSTDDYADGAVKTRFKSKILSEDERNAVKSVLPLDAVDFLYNGVLCLVEGLVNACNRRYSWATVQLYYSIYYFLRSSLATKGIAILRCCSMFRLVTSDLCAAPYGTTHKKYNTTHEGTISHYRDLFSDSDFLLSNMVDGETSCYDWMKQAREIVNYRSRAFLEPQCLSFWEYYDSCIADGSFFSDICSLTKDDEKCFQSDFAIISIPLKRYQLTKKDFDKAFPHMLFSKERSVFIESELSFIPDLIPLFASFLV